MERIPEPELMDDEAQAIAYAEADFEEPHSEFISLFQEIFGHYGISGYVLDLGCGSADITCRFARAYQNCFIHGIDGSEPMLRCGKRILDKSIDIHNRIELIQGILPEAKLPREKYDVIISNSLLHHLSNPHVLWDIVKLYAFSGAPIFIKDLKRPESPDEARAIVEKYSGKEPDILKQDFYNSLLAAFEVEEIVEQLKVAGLAYLSVQVVSDRHIVISGYMI